ncbi:MAG: PilZ domain-containing protein [bacterium]|nr:PilZ domain-containing protein [bacterium]
MSPRQFTRVQFNLGVQIQLPNFNHFSVESRDLSLNGIFVASDTPLPIGTACQITLFPAAGLGVPSFHMMGEVIRVEETGLGIKFTEIPQGSKYHLYELMLSQTQDLDNIKEEFETAPKNTDIFML